MKKEKIIHEKNTNQIASKGKIFLGAIFDFCLNMVLLLIIFGSSMSIAGASGFYNNYNESKNELLNHLVETKLIEKDKDGNAQNTNLGAANYIIKLVKTGCYYYDLDYKEIDPKDNKEMIISKEELKKDLIFLKDENNIFINDNLSYYYLNYRESDNSDLSEERKKIYNSSFLEESIEYTNKFNYFYSGALLLNYPNYSQYFNRNILNDYLDDNDDFYKEINGEISLLNKATTQAIKDYVSLNRYSKSAKKIVDDLIYIYNNALNFAFGELNSYSSTYIKLFTDANNSELKIYQNQVGILVLSYLLSFLIYYCLIPVFLKEGRTLGLKFNGLTYSTTKDDYPSFKNIIIKDSLLFLTQAIVMMFPALFLGGQNLLFANLGFNIRFIYIMLFFGLLTLSSVIFAASNKNHQFLSEYTSLLVQKDINSLKISEENSVID